MVAKESGDMQRLLEICKLGEEDIASQDNVDFIAVRKLDWVK